MFKAMLSWRHPDVPKVQVAFVSFGSRLDAEVFLASFRPNENAVIEIFEAADSAPQQVSDAAR